MENHYQNGVPQRITHVDEPGKTRRFVIRGAIIWLGVLALYLAMWEWVLPLMIEPMSNWILVPLFIIYSQLLLATFIPTLKRFGNPNHLQVRHMLTEAVGTRPTAQQHRR